MTSLTFGKKLPLILEQCHIVRETIGPQSSITPHYMQVSVQTYFETQQYNPSSTEGGRLLICEALEV
jgi:hypothetical protein